MTMRVATVLAALISTALVAQAPVPAPTHAAAGSFDPARAAVIDRALHRYIDTDRVPGIVALVMQDGQVVYEKAFGWADREAGRRMATDAIFRIASQTKALTSAAIMQLVEEGMRRGGSLDGARILSPLSVRLMATNQVGTLHSTTGLGFGYGFETVDRFGANGMSHEGAFGWGGAYGSVYRVDPEARLVMLLMMQLIPNATDVRDAFPSLVYQALQK